MEFQRTKQERSLRLDCCYATQAPFTGSFSPNCLSEPVPNSLLTLLRVLLEGAGGMDVAGNTEKVTARIRVALALSQLVISNAVNESSNAQHLYQVRKRETPFPLYVGLKLHCQGRQKKFIKNLYNAGISVSHDRVIDLRQKSVQAVSKRFRVQGVVVPVNCKRCVFITGTTDNIDVSGRTDMHGTSITLICHLSKDNMGVDPLPLLMDVPDDTLVDLADEYAVVP